VTRFADRAHAGRELARAVEPVARGADAAVLGLARGGMPVAAEVAQELRLPLDVFVVRKLGVPGHEEVALGAIASGSVRVVNLHVRDAIGISSERLDELTARERQQLERRERAYRDDRPPLDVTAMTAMLVDDGLATGSSMRAAVRALRQRDPARVVVAVPIAPPDTCARLRRAADEVICARSPDEFVAVGEWYDDFAQTTDEDVRRLLAARAAVPRP
jgi:predicted phosphoribosyltransferase